jgi:DNA repair exonuclease SbcCD ATPase subunit
MIRFQRITVQAFRGIPDRIDLDLSAPLTLLYAPNGSGKTTICDAAEWLLTGVIKRLKSSDVEDDGELRCRFAKTSVVTMVSAVLDVDGERVELERKRNACRWRLGDEPWTAVNKGDLLEKLAPSAVEEDVHRTHANNSRQIWLRGTRFLSGEALATLLDSDEDSLQSRQRLFADLLGVGHLLETERQLDGYLSEINQYLRDAQTRLDDKEVEIANRESKLSRDINAARTDRLGGTLALLRTASGQLKRRFTPPRQATLTNLGSALAAIRADLEGQKIRWNQARQAEQRLTADWPQRDALAQSVAADQARLAALTEEETTAQAALTAANTELQAAATECSKAQERMRSLELRDKALKDVDARMRPLLQRYLQTLADDKLDRRTAFALIDEGGTDRARLARMAQLRQIFAELPLIQTQTLERDRRKAEYDAASEAAPSSEAIASTRDAVAAADTHVGGLRLAYQRAAAPLEQLQQLSLTVVDALGHDEHTCPVCAHDWRSAAALRQALKAAATGSPASLNALGEQLRQAEEQQKIAQDRMLRENQALGRAVDAEKTFRGLDAVIAGFAVKLRQAGLEDDIASVKASAERSLARMELLPLLREVRDEVAAAESTVNRRVPDTTQLAVLAAQLAPSFVEALAGVRAVLEKANARHASAITAVAAATEATRKQHIERDAVSRRVQQNSGRIQVLRTAWQTLANDRPWTDNERAAVTTDLRAQFEAHQAVEQTLVQADALLRDQAAAQELEELRKERTPLIAERDRLRSYAEAARAIKEAYNDSQKKHIKQQMADFVRVISALFLRMQSNLVYDDVAGGDDATPLSWRAQAENLSLNPEATFSQGQRQDFALSIFLARARGLSGTFVLDEPVAHLDDLNRVALLDVFRAITLERLPGLSFVMTTANKPLVRHLLEKFARVSTAQDAAAQKLLNLVGIEGNPRTGVRIVQGADLFSAL